MVAEGKAGRACKGSGRKGKGCPTRLLPGSDAARLYTALQELLARGVPLKLSLQRAGGKLETPCSYVRRMPVRQPGGVILFLPVEQIEWIEASDQYVRLHAGGKKHLVRESIAHLGSRLDPAQFRRIHRSAIVNLHRIRELHVESQTQRWAVLVNGDRLQVSKAYWKELQEALVGLD